MENYRNILIIFFNLAVMKIEALDFMIMAAQCESSCIYKMGMQNPLSLMQKRTVKNYNRVESLLYSQCFAHSDCLACVKPCSQPFSEFSLCLDHCKGIEVSKKKSCMESCAFLRDININKVGNCPSVQQMSGFALACIESCQKDSDCGGTQKCCAHRCGRTCQYPDTITEDVPPKPIFSVVTKDTEKDNEGRTIIRLEWMIPSSYFETSLSNNVSLSSILYVIQSQINVNAKDQQPQLSEWRDIAITDDSGITLKEHLPGSWIRFRVASINPNGTLGYSEPSAPIIFTNSLNGPEMPINLTIGEYVIGQSGKINQIVHWSHPKSDLPIVKYKIFWSQNAQTSNDASRLGLSLQQYKKVIKGDSTSYTINELEPETTYFIQLQAYSQKGDLKLRGDKASIFLTTPNLYESDYDAIKTKLFGPVFKAQAHAKELILRADDRAMTESKKIVLQNISTGVPYYQKGSLKVKVQWRTLLSPTTTIDGKPNTETEMRKLILDKFAIKWHAEVCIESRSAFLNKRTKRKRRNKEEDDNWELDRIGEDEMFSNQGSSNEREDQWEKVADNEIRETPSDLEFYTTDNSFVIYDLKFDCRYAISITPIYKEVSNQKQRVTYSHQFQTPPCTEIVVKDTKKPICHIQNPPPKSPQNLTSHIYFIDGYNITALITWRPPVLSAVEDNKASVGFGSSKISKTITPNLNIIGYRLVFYGKRGNSITQQDGTQYDRANVAPNQLDDKDIENTTSAFEKTNNVLVKVFSPFQTSFHVSDLLHDRDYAVDVQAFSEAGPGSVSHLEFRTPPLNDQGYIQGPLYQRLRHESRTGNDNNLGFANFKEPGNSDIWKRVSHNKVSADLGQASRYFYYSSADNGPYGNVRYSSHPKTTYTHYRKYLMRAKSHSSTTHTSSVRLKLLMMLILLTLRILLS